MSIRNVFSKFGAVKMVNARHVASGGFAFVFFEDESGAANALVDPRVPVKDRVTNVLVRHSVHLLCVYWLRVITSKCLIL